MLALEEGRGLELLKNKNNGQRKIFLSFFQRTYGTSGKGEFP